MRRSDLQLLSDRSFRRLWLARTVSILGSALTPVALAFGVLDIPGAGAKELALVVTASSIAMIATILAGGVLGDRFPRTRILMLAELLAGVAIGSVAVLFITGNATPWRIAGFGVLAGGAEGLLFPVLAGVVPDIVPEERLQSANGLLRFSQSSVQIGGAALAGILVASVGPGITLSLDALSFFIAVVIVARIPTVRRDVSEEAGLIQQLREGWRGFISFRWIWATTLSATIWVGIFHASFAVLGPVVAKSSLGGARGWATVLAFFSGGAVLGTLFATRMKPKRPMVVVAYLFQPGAVFVALLAVPATLPWMVVGAIGLGVSFSIITVLWDTMLQTHVPEGMLARVSSYDALGSMAAIPVSTAVIGSVAAAIGLQRTLEISAGVMFVSGLLPLMVRDVWRIGLTKADAAEQLEPSDAPDPAQASSTI